jgi:hypothetical protein
LYGAVTSRIKAQHENDPPSIHALRGQRYKPTNPKTNLGAFTGTVFGQDPQAVSCDCFSRVGQPMVDSDGSTYVEYNAREATSNVTTSAILALMKIAPDGTVAGVTQLTSTSSGNDGEIWPGAIIPDGQGGVLATWTVLPAVGHQPPANPYQAAHVTPDGGLSIYPLPMAPAQPLTDNNGLPVDLPLVLGENGVAFISYGTNVVSFNLSSGAVNWNYQAAAQTGVSIIASTAGNGLVAKTTTSGTSGIDTVIRLDSTGAATPDTWTASGIGYLAGGLWPGFASSVGLAAFFAAPVDWSDSIWPEPSGDREGQEAARQKIKLSVTKIVEGVPAGPTEDGLITTWVNDAIKYWNQEADVLLDWGGQIKAQSACPATNPRCDVQNDQQSLYSICSGNFQDVRSRFPAPKGIDLIFTHQICGGTSPGQTLNQGNDANGDLIFENKVALRGDVGFGIIVAHEIGHTFQLQHVGNILASNRSNLMCGPTNNPLDLLAPNCDPTKTLDLLQDQLTKALQNAPKWQ